VLTSDYTESLGSYTFTAYYTDNGGSQVAQTSGSLSGNQEWVNNSKFFSPQGPGDYNIELNITDNLGFTTSQNISLDVTEKPVSFTLNNPKDLVGIEGATSVNQSFNFDADLPSPGTITLFYNKPGSSTAFTKNGNISVDGITYSNLEIKEMIGNISYNNIAGENYDASNEYEWYLSYESNKTGDTVTSNIQSWRYTDQEETVEPEQGLFEDLGFVIGLIVFLILLIIPLYVKFVYWND